MHLLSERLAQLADDEPTAAEAMHLASCSQCATARRFQQDLLMASRKHGEREGTVLTTWESLSPKLAAAGLIAAPASKSRAVSRGMRRIAMLAASLLLVVAGTAAGRISAGASIVPASLPGRSTGKQGSEREFASTAEALNVFLTSQRDYQRAAAFLAANDEVPRDEQRTYLTRLAALEDMHAASVAALREEPTDPVMNSFYVSTLNARDVTRQQINRMLPVGLRRSTY